MKSIAIKLAGGALAVLAVAGIGLAVVQPTFAQDPTPTTPQEPCGGEKGLLADYAYIMEEAIADALGVSVEELQAAKEDGTARQLVEDSGVDMETLQAARDAAREEMISQALADGVITEEQAQMLREHQGRPGGHGGPRGGGRPGGVPPTDNPGA